MAIFYNVACALNGDVRAHYPVCCPKYGSPTILFPSESYWMVPGTFDHNGNPTP